MKIEIKSITGNVLFSYECEGNNLKTTLIKAVEGGANLYGANLYGANLDGAYLRGAKDIDGRLIDNCFTIYGSKHSVVWFGDGNIRIGCYCKKIQEWKEVYKSVGEAEGYAIEQLNHFI